MFSFSASYLQINSGLQIPQNYKSLISNKKVFLYKYAKILTYKLMVIRGVVFMHWLMEQQVVSAHVSHSGVLINDHMESKCWSTEGLFFQEIWLESVMTAMVILLILIDVCSLVKYFSKKLILRAMPLTTDGWSSKSHMWCCLLVMVDGYDPDLLTWTLLLH